MWLVLGVFALASSFIVTHAQQCVPPPAGIISWWPGDGTAADIVGPNDGALHKGAGYGSGMVGQAFHFDGVNDYMRAPVTGFPVGSHDRTLEMWVNIEAFVVVESFFAGYGFPVPNSFYDVGTNATRGNSVFLSSWGPAVFGPALATGRWYHVAATNIGTYGRLYLDGELVAEGDLSINTIVAEPYTWIFMGTVPTEIGDIRKLQGSVDEVTVYDRALSDSEIRSIFNAGSAGKCKVTNIAIDIKPGTFPNSINPRSKGVIPVAILTTDTFDATAVDPTTVRFGPNGAEAAPVQSALEDIDGDGDTDMILHFKTQDTGIVCGDTSASLTGETFGGQAIEGSDSIKTVGCK